MGGLALPLLFFAAMYFLLIAPNQKKQKSWQQMLSNIKAGDQVTTSGGLRGLVLSVKDDIVLVRVAPDNLRMEFVKSAIATVVTADAAA
jgi:preprotein translocase subunit YajC